MCLLATSRAALTSVNFEHIYHCAHELLSTFEPTAGAVNAFFVRSSSPLLAVGLRLTSRHREHSSVAWPSSSSPSYRRFAPDQGNLAPLTAFISRRWQPDHITRIYTTNYDDFLLQAAPGLYTGFDPTSSPDPKSFDLRRGVLEGRRH